MRLEQELQEIARQCNCEPNPDIVAGWNAAKDGFYSPPYNLSRERSRDWVKGNKAFRTRAITNPEILTKDEAYAAGYQSFFSNGGKLINICKGKGELEYSFEDGWSQAYRKQTARKPLTTSDTSDNPSTLKEKYSNINNSRRSSSDRINRYKLLKDGE